jgi:hypothetical protein
VKHELGNSFVKQEDVRHNATEKKIKRKPGGDNVNAQTPVLPGQVPTVSTPCTEASDPVVPADNERNKKRKALQEELTAIELEQKRVRVAKELADLDNED